MTYDPLRHHRRSLRTRGHDYSAEGGYFVTICTHDRECNLGEIVNNRIQLSKIGRIVSEGWGALLKEFQNVEIDEYQIMPDHIHGIVVLLDKSAGLIVNCATRDLINQIPRFDQITAGSRRPPNDPITWGAHCAKPSEETNWPLMKDPRQTLGKIIRHFKAKATKRIHDSGFSDFEWQRGYFDRIIRGESDLDRIRCYIRNNPLRWSERNWEEIERA